jgi:hypothetical protein
MANGNGKVGGLSMAVQMFCDRYKHHPTKRVFYVYDHTAVGRRVDADRYADMVISILKRNRWSVHPIYSGQAPLHYQKYEDTKKTLTGDAPITITINADRCPKTIESIQGAVATTINGKTEKHKGNEKDATIDQSTTTHFSDVVDQINHAVIKQRKIKPGGSFSVGGARIR